jgi:BirA family transcriptional regulator, biotin operon repressor / biotin---[acetyl-CoA-carboxylase] ligase
MVCAMWAGQWEVRRFDEIDSTNSYLKAQASEGAPDGLVAVADHQTAGRGRLDRRWEAPPGASLLLSVLMRPALDPADLHLCTAAVALAGAEAIRLVGGVSPGLKWPNDLVIGPAKLAGVLAEADLGGGTVRWVVVGIGINVAWPGPPDVGGTCLDDQRSDGGLTDRAELFKAFLGALTARRTALETLEGRRELAAELGGACDTLGARVRVDLAGESFSGLATEIDQAGHLIVVTESGPRTVSAGDVVHLRADQG